MSIKYIGQVRNENYTNLYIAFRSFLERMLFPSIYKNFRTIRQHVTKKSNIVRFPESLKCIKLGKKIPPNIILNIKNLSSQLTVTLISVKI